MLRCSCSTRDSKITNRQEQHEHHRRTCDFLASFAPGSSRYCEEGVRRNGGAAREDDARYSVGEDPFQERVHLLSSSILDLLERDSWVLDPCSACTTRFSLSRKEKRRRMHGNRSGIADATKEGQCRRYLRQSRQLSLAQSCWITALVPDYARD